MSVEEELTKKCLLFAEELANASIINANKDDEIRRLKDTISKRDGDWTSLRDEYHTLLTNLATEGREEVGILNAKIGLIKNALNKIYLVENSNDSDGDVRMKNYGIAKCALDDLNEFKNKPINMEENRPDTAIVIITYNNSRLIKKQVELIRRFHKDPVDIIIVDNSCDPEAAEQIDYYNKSELKCRYLKTDASSKNGSDSHSFSANLSYLNFKNDYSFMMYLDFDCFPTRSFSVKELLGQSIMTGMGQRKGELEYFWPGCVCWNNSSIDRSLIDFSCNHDLGVDTGGLLYRVIERYGKIICPFLNEIHVQNPNFTKSFYNFYSEINNGMFMHFINSSNWNPTDGHEERINSLMNILDEKTK